MAILTLPVFYGKNLVGTYRGCYTEKNTNKQTGEIYEQIVMGFAREYVDKFGDVVSYTDTAIVSKALVQQGFPHLMNAMINQLIAVPVTDMTNIGTKEVKTYIREEALAMFHAPQEQPK